MKIIVMFPDYKGEGSAGGFIEKILGVVPDAIVVPVLNGLTARGMDFISLEAERVEHCETVMAVSAKGLLSTLSMGYDTILDWYGDDVVVVRLDTAEHPVSAIPLLVRKAVEIQGMVIGDLTFGEETLRSESIDEFAHRDSFPELWRQYTGGRLALSGAYGFQVFAPGVLRNVYRFAQDIVREARTMTAEEIEWGFDGAMALSAIGFEPPVVVEGVPAVTLRDRPRAKVAQQFARALLMCRAAESLRHKQEVYRASLFGD